ncbi:hypothetical protein FVE85_7672 [Porphyridium purpureum]|uniref:Uncharacterized protein n=1 Tax=Porphyridium purpureum TaxID=35688 RepID=A0A5J4ZBR9_PORPP|nr:hypothetical protein FVE85_7672 [Porphyridium purpureum]|eukprot:POR0438..scf295_1
MAQHAGVDLAVDELGERFETRVDAEWGRRAFGLPQGSGDSRLWPNHSTDIRCRLRASHKDATEPQRSAAAEESGDCDFLLREFGAIHVYHVYSLLFGNEETMRGLGASKAWSWGTYVSEWLNPHVSETQEHVRRTRIIFLRVKKASKVYLVFAGVVGFRLIDPTKSDSDRRPRLIIDVLMRQQLHLDNIASVAVDVLKKAFNIPNLNEPVRIGANSQHCSAGAIGMPDIRDVNYRKDKGQVRVPIDQLKRDNAHQPLAWQSVEIWCSTTNSRACLYSTAPGGAGRSVSIRKNYRFEFVLCTDLELDRNTLYALVVYDKSLDGGGTSKLLWMRNITTDRNPFDFFFTQTCFQISKGGKGWKQVSDDIMQTSVEYTHARGPIEELKNAEFHVLLLDVCKNVVLVEGTVRTNQSRANQAGPSCAMVAQTDAARLSMPRTCDSGRDQTSGGEKRRLAGKSAKRRRRQRKGNAVDEPWLDLNDPILLPPPPRDESDAKGEDVQGSIGAQNGKKTKKAAHCDSDGNLLPCSEDEGNTDQLSGLQDDSDDPLGDKMNREFAKLSLHGNNFEGYA